ncbi:MAG TPA: sporulation killing factor system radical SAM maturase [Acidimicrobiales bacterium]|nr:sporulation killing factor system radical SAM maturase [Acidimicrobiales bacterium]
MEPVRPGPVAGQPGGRRGRATAVADGPGTGPQPVEPPPYRPTWVLHLQPGSAILVERHSQYYVRLSAEATEIALLLARTADLERSGRVLAAVGGPGDGGGAPLGDRLAPNPFTAAWARGLLGDDLRVTGSSQAYIPLTCSLQLTNGCNLRCSFCYASSGRRYPEELTLPDWIRTMQVLAASGVCSVTLTGGEPTIAEGFPRILAAAGAYFVNVDVFTNGLHWTDEARRVAGALGNVRCQVSIDGLPERHDRVRGRAGAYDSALTTVRELREEGIAVSVAMTVTPENFGDVGPLVDEAAEAGAVMFRAGRVQGVGRGDAIGFSLDTTQEEAVTAALGDAASRCPSIHVLRWDVCETDADRVAAAAGAPAEFMTPGYLHWHVRADGWVTPCQIEDAPMGHILRDSLTDIGHPDRIAEVAAQARGCRCIRRVQLPAGAGPPFVGAARTRAGRAR